MFTVEQRDAVRRRVLRLGRSDARTVAAAVVGSLAVGRGDAYSDVDISVAVADHVGIAEVLDDWTATLINECAAVVLVDLHVGPTVYRVFLLPEMLQLDLSMTSASQFRPAGPRFQLVYGSVAAGGPSVPRSSASLFIATPPIARDIFGWGVIYAMHARACIERQRVWQAEHYVSTVRDHALSLACLRHGLVAVQARGYDDLPAEALVVFDGTHVEGVSCAALRSALRATVHALLYEGQEAGLDTANIVAERLADLV